ncbi:MAG: 4Fe-4S dicluster domain-containing protein [Polyangiaceae bacterium]
MKEPRLSPLVPEFHPGEDQAPDEFSRRHFLSYGAAALALAGTGLGACTRAPAEKIVPYRVAPNEVIPGRALHYASASTLDGYASGILVESHEGRPTKVEGNPEHPSSLGASSAFQQAALLELYNPLRIGGVSRNGASAARSALFAQLADIANVEQAGRGLHLVLPAFSSPLLADQLVRVRERLPESTVHFHSPVSRSNVWQGAERAFGAPLETVPDLRRADVIVSLGADFLASGPDQLKLARQFADRRRMSSKRDTMNRLYVIETNPSVTGSMADHRMAVPPSHVARLAAALLREVALAQSAQIPEQVLSLLASEPRISPVYSRFLGALGRDLLRQRASAVVLVDARQPPEVHAAAHAINALLGSSKGIIGYVASPIVGSEDPGFGSLRALHDALRAGEVRSLLSFDSDFVYASPASFDFAHLLGKVEQSISFSAFEDATARACTWRAPAAHELESWLDTRALDGTTSLVQPLIAPLHGGLTLSEVFSRLLGDNRSAHDTLRAAWLSKNPEHFQQFWETSLAHGVIEGSASTPDEPTLRWDFVGDLIHRSSVPDRIELNLELDSRVHDGRFGDNPWLLELPCPVTKLTWGNAALLSPELAHRLGIVDGQVVRLEAAGRSAQAPALVVPGHSAEAVTLTLGWGREGTTGNAPLGANGYALLSPLGDPPPLVRLVPTEKREPLAITQEYVSLGDLESAIFQSATLEEYQKAGQIGAEQRKKQLSLYTSDAPKAARQWGMTIDLNACTGCSACVIACQAENNVPTVGRDGVLAHREMHWLRVDRYVSGSGSATRIQLQPMACQHCERAPCEYVCPTGATVHSSDGLNQMIYNRCVGTRFCSNNCPYKVRRFNWFNYHTSDDPLRELARNPEVTVRGRGVMEKCTYCVQRIRKTENLARSEGRTLVDGNVVTACEQACPTRAITFGDIDDAQSRVALARASDRAFNVLNDLGAAPRTRYLAKLTNPNPELA